MNKINYHAELEKKLAGIKENKIRPTLLLHSCCAPCSSYVLQYLTEYFDIAVFYYNPNIFPQEEYEKRLQEQRRLVSEMPFAGTVSVIAGTYEPEKFCRYVKGFEDEPEGAKRCSRCFALRLEASAKKAVEIQADFFATTLTVSPHKNAAVINEAGMRVSEKYGKDFLCSDFKKKEGFKKSLILSEEYHLYRQDYCGCRFSQR